MPINILFCYAREDESFLNRLKAHLKPLQRQGRVEVWHDRDISAGAEWEHEINHHLNTAQIILLLISPDFMDSDYCYGVEMKRALERHEHGEVTVIPIILRHIYWQGILGKLQALPTDAIPVTDPYWYDLDRAFFNVIEGILKVLNELEKVTSQKPALGTTLRTNAYNEQVNTVAWSPNGAYIASAGKQIAIWDSSTGYQLFTIPNHSIPLQAVVWSPNSQFIAASAWDNTVRVWDIASDRNITSYHGHNKPVNAVAWSPDSTHIASGSADKTVKIWQAT
jgi:WD40 repeat protein